MNAITILDPFPVPVVQESIASIAGKKYYFFADGLSGYNQCAVDDYTSKRTALISQFNVYETDVMEWGPKNSGQHFCKVLGKHYNTLKMKNIVLQHVDDLGGGNDANPPRSE